MHPTLARQLKKLALDPDSPPSAKAWAEFVKRVEATYHEHEDDRALMERSLEISGIEMLELHQELRHAANSQVSAERDRLATIVTAIGDGLCVLDRDGLCTLSNTAAQHMIADAELEGQWLLDRLLLSEHHEALTQEERFERIWIAIADQLTLEFPEAWLISPQRKIPVFCTISPLIQNEQITGCVLIFKDMSHMRDHERELTLLNEELTIARDRALEANQSKSIFLANMSHELRTPLNAIIGYAELVHEDAVEDERFSLAEDAQKIRLSANHLLQVINDILDISKIEAGKMEVYAETFSVEELIHQSKATTGPLIERNRNTLIINHPSYLPPLHTDKLKLRQAIMNLLSNAAKFTQDGTITLDVSIDDALRTLHIEVQDTGIGISPDRMDRLFDAFIQADQSTTRQYGGTGLGLSITRQFCRLLGGEVTATSEPGRGSTFTIEIPVTLHNEETQPTPQNIERAQPGRERVVLAIDDDPHVFELLERFLAKEGFTVIHAPNGEEGIKLAKQLLPDVITLDVMMPRQDGWSVLHALKADETTRDIPVVMLTIVPDRQRGYALGAVDYLTKPIDRTRLIEVLSRHIKPPNQVMVVEDDDHTRELLRRTLESHQMRVIEAVNGRDAITALGALTHEELPSVILLDLMMPLLDGFQVLDLLREHEDWREIPVIILTAKELSIHEISRLRERTAQVLQKASNSPQGVIKAIERAQRLSVRHH